jgi:hypothetical protein
MMQAFNDIHKSLDYLLPNDGDASCITLILQRRLTSYDGRFGLVRQFHCTSLMAAAVTAAKNCF